MSILDSGPFRDRIIGKTTLSVQNLIKDGGVDEWIEIFYTEKKQEKSGGKIRLISKWKPLLQEESKEDTHKDLVKKTESLTLNSQTTSQVIAKDQPKTQA